MALVEKMVINIITMWPALMFAARRKERERLARPRGVPSRGP